MNICGCLLHVVPERMAQTRPLLEAVDGVEVHAQSEDGRFVVVVEDTAAKRASEIIMDMHQIPGVVSLTLTYHHFEDDAPRRPSPRPVSSQAGGPTHDHI